jgi:hypothetical protein
MRPKRNRIGISQAKSPIDGSSRLKWRDHTERRPLSEARTAHSRGSSCQTKAGRIEVGFVKVSDAKGWAGDAFYSIMTTPPLLPVKCVMADEWMYEPPTMVTVLATIDVAVALAVLPPV